MGYLDLFTHGNAELHQDDALAEYGIARTKYFVALPIYTLNATLAFVIRVVEILQRVWKRSAKQLVAPE